MVTSVSTGSRKEYWVPYKELSYQGDDRGRSTVPSISDDPSATYLSWKRDPVKIFKRTLKIAETRFDLFRI